VDLKLPVFKSPLDDDAMNQRFQEAKNKFGNDWDAKHPQGKARELRKLKQEGASSQFSKVLIDSMGGQKVPDLAQQVLGQNGQDIAGMTDAIKSALGGDDELQKKITTALGDGKGIEGVVGAVLQGFSEKEGGLQNMIKSALDGLPADGQLQGILQQAMQASGGSQGMMQNVIANLGGKEGLMKTVMDKMKDGKMDDIIKSATAAAEAAGKGDPMANFLDQAIEMIGGEEGTKNLGGDDSVKKIMSKAMKRVLEGESGDRLKSVLQASFKGEANSTTNSSKILSATMDKVASGDLQGVVHSLLGELGESGMMEKMVKEALSSLSGNTDGLSALVDEALKGPIGQSIPGGTDGMLGKMMKDMAVNMANNPDSLAKIVTQSLKGGSKAGGLDIASMVVKGLSKRFGVAGGDAESDSGVEALASRDLAQQYMKKMLDSSKVDPLNNIGQEFMAMMKGVMKDQNLDPDQYGPLLKQTLKQDDVKQMIDEALRKNLESGSIGAMVEETLRKEFPFVPIEAVKPMITTLLESQMQSGQLQGLLSSFVTEQVEAAASGKEPPSVMDLQARLMEELSSVMPGVADVLGNKENKV